MGRMVIYHGSYIEIKEPEIIIGRNTKDFGSGFYCTVFREQSIRWAKRYNQAILNSYEFRMNTDLSILEFETMSEQWLDFIIDCRNGKPHDYDIVIGAMANDQIYNYIADYIDGIITREQFWSLAKFKYPTHQICFCSTDAFECLNFIKSEEINENDW